MLFSASQEFFIQRLFFPDMLMKMNSHVTQQQTPCGEFSLRTLADGSFFPFLLHSFLPFPSLVHLLWPPWGFSCPLCACSREHWHGFFASMKSLKWDWLFSMATTPSLTRYSFAYSLNHSVDLRVYIYAQSNCRLVLLRQQNKVFFFWSFVPCIRGSMS